MVQKELMVATGIQAWLDALDDEVRTKETIDEVEQEDFRDFFGKRLGSYEFEEGKGLCGILTPTGHFIQCHDRQHSLVSELLKSDELFLTIFFSSKLSEGDMSVYTHHIDNSTVHSDRNFRKERFLANLGLYEKKNELLKKILVTEGQVEFIEKNYVYLNESQKQMLTVMLTEDSDETSEFKGKDINDKYYIIKG